VPHRHGSAFVYACVLEGAVRNQLEGEPMRTYHQGANWIEQPGAHHVATENASNTEPAEFLVVFVVVALREFSKPESIAQFFEFVRRMADEATDSSTTVRFAPVLFQPIAGDDVAQAVGKIAAGSPLNGKAEVAVPEQFRMDEFFRSALAMRDDPRTVVTDPHASYVGTELGERTLLPGADAIPGEIRYSNWPGRTGSGK
jgi:hypothetical protein